MKTITKISLIVFLNVTFMQSQIIQKWMQLGVGTPKNLTSMPSMVFDRNGNLYLAYTDQSTPQNKATLKKFNGQTWTTLSSQFTPGQALFIKLDLDSADVPYVAFQEPYPVTKKITVMKFKGTGWDTIGSRGFATADFNNPELDFTINPQYNMPNVAFRENSTGKASVMLNAGSGWVYSGGAGITQGNASKLSLASQGNVTYLAFRNGVKGDKLSVLSDNGGGGWTYSGDTVKSIGIPDYINCRRYVGGTTPFVAVAFKDLADDKAYLKTSYNNSPWTTTNNSPVSGGLANYVTLAQKRGLPVNSSFYCGYADGTSSGNATVKKTLNMSPNGYTLVGKKGFTDTLGAFASAYYGTLGIDKYDSLYMVVQSFNEYVVFKYRSINTNLVGVSGSSYSNEVSVYPNPNSGEFTIETPQALKIIVFNALGQIVSQQNLLQGKNKIDLNNQANGIYFLELKQETKSMRVKIIKQ